MDGSRATFQHRRRQTRRRQRIESVQFPTTSTPMTSTTKRRIFTRQNDNPTLSSTQAMLPVGHSSVVDECPISHDFVNGVDEEVTDVTREARFFTPICHQNSRWFHSVQFSTVSTTTSTTEWQNSSLITRFFIRLWNAKRRPNARRSLNPKNLLEDTRKRFPLLPKQTSHNKISDEPLAEN